jgi:hypothetical protein
VYTHFPFDEKSTDNARRRKIPTRRLVCEYGENGGLDRAKESGAAFGLFSERVPEGHGSFGEKFRYTR